MFAKPEDQPTRPQHDRNIENFFAVTLRDSGEVAIIDGDTKEIVNIVKTGYAVHTSRSPRSSHSGRYVYTIGRDAKVDLIDLWMDPPDRVAEIKIGLEARAARSKWRLEPLELLEPRTPPSGLRQCLVCGLTKL